MTDIELKRSVVDKIGLPGLYPTHLLGSPFWEHLGRVVGNYGAFEEVLGKVIFALTGTRRVEESSAESALKTWEVTLEHALKDPLGPLIEAFGKSVREHPEATLENLDDLLKDLREASRMRNALCHGSWQLPDKLGRSKPLFVDKQMRVFDTAVDVPFLQQVQRHVAELICEVSSTVTHMGYQFPGSDGPGKPVG